MFYNLLSLLSTTAILGFGIIGSLTVVNKAGHFLKRMETEEKDAYKKAFDKLMIETIDEINFSIDSIGIISKHTYKNIKLLFDILYGNKCIKKDKDGKIIISDKSKLNKEYEEKIEHLYTKLKKYQNEVKKYKNSDNNSESKNSDDNDSKKKSNNNSESKKIDDNSNKKIETQNDTNNDSDSTLSDDSHEEETDELEYYLE
jgi:hypothetical protein